MMTMSVRSKLSLAINHKSALKQQTTAHFMVDEAQTESSESIHDDDDES